MAYGFLYEDIGWRGLRIGILPPALVVVWIASSSGSRRCGRRSKRQQAGESEVKAPLFVIFTRRHIFNTLTGCLWMGAAFCVYYSIWALFSTYLQRLQWTPGMVATPLFWANIVVFAGPAVGQRLRQVGRRPAIIVLHHRHLRHAALSVDDRSLWIVLGFILQGVFGGSITARIRLSQRALPDRGAGDSLRLRLSQGAIWGGLIAPVISYLPSSRRWLCHAHDAEHHLLPGDRHHRRGAGPRPRARSSPPIWRP